MVEDGANESADSESTDDFPLSDHPSALLTESQRRYVMGYSDIDPKSPEERAIRARIRKRLTQTLVDLSLLESNMEARDVEAAFDNKNAYQSAPDALKLIFDGMSRADVFDAPSWVDDLPSHNQDLVHFFEFYIQNILRGIYRSRGFDVRGVDVSIDFEFGQTLDELTDKQIEDLDPSELTLLLEHGEISHSEFFRIAKESEDIEISLVKSDDIE